MFSAKAAITRFSTPKVTSISTRLYDAFLHWNPNSHKFNRVSERVGSDVRLAADDWHRTGRGVEAPKIERMAETHESRERGNF